jgi:hypothetical protein
MGAATASSGAGGGASGSGLGGWTDSGVDPLPDLVLDADYLVDTKECGHASPSKHAVPRL